ncbi:MAG: tetratricopeptide repeat protein [Myxococcales bacterium]|nr:tetratricopeptide repeat protein [Myxococcales bacterium]
MNRHPSRGRVPSASGISLLLLVLLMGACGGTTPGGRLASPSRAQEAPRLTAAQLIDLGRAFLQRGDTVRAEQYWVRALALGAAPRRVLPLLLSAYIHDHQYRLAIQHGEEYLRKHPREPTLQLLVGSLHEALGAYQPAIEHYSAAVRRQPAGAEGHYALASALLQQGHDRPRADAHFRRYLELEPNGPHAELARAALLQELSP